MKPLKTVSQPSKRPNVYAHTVQTQKHEKQVQHDQALFHDIPADSLSNYPLVTRESTLKLPGVIQCGPRDMCKIDSVISDWAPSSDYLPQGAAVSEPWAACQMRKMNIGQCCKLLASSTDISRKSLRKAK